MDAGTQPPFQPWANQLSEYSEGSPWISPSATYGASSTGACSAGAWSTGACGASGATGVEASGASWVTELSAGHGASMVTSSRPGYCALNSSTLSVTSIGPPSKFSL